MSAILPTLAMCPFLTHPPTKLRNAAERSSVLPLLLARVPSPTGSTPFFRDAHCALALRDDRLLNKKGV